MAYQADVPGSVARGPRFGPTHQHSTMPDESVLYGIRSKGCAKRVTTSWLFVTFDTDGEVLQALVRCIGIVVI
jgi:hypothetical protein